MNRSLVRAATVAGVPFVLVALAVPAQAAGNGHFIASATSVSGSGPNLTVAFKEAGLGAGSVETISASANTATAYECVNGGGTNPAASNKKTFSTKRTASGTFTADRNGNVVGRLTLTPPSAASLGFRCPNGQTTTFVSVSYSGLVLSDSTSGASLAFSGSYSYTNPAAPPVR
jgi:hypothetical protein